MFTPTRILGVIAIAASASALVLLALRHIPAQSDASSTAPRTRSGEGRLHEVGAAALEGSRAAIPRAAAHTTIATDTVPDVADKGRIKALHQAQLQLYATTFTQEPVDATWASGAEAVIRTVLGRSKQPVTSSQVQCKRSLCRVELSYDKPREGHAVLQWMLRDHPWPGVVFTRNDAERHSAIAYYARHGHELPKVSPETLAL